MKKQLHKIKIAAENFSRPTKADKNSEELLAADRHVEKYKDVLDKICKKFVQNPSSSSSNTNSINIDQDAREKRCKKVHEYKLALSMEESLKDLPEGLLRDVLENCAKLEKSIATEIVNNEINIENDVTKKLTVILENHIGTIQKQKRIVTKLMQDNESAKNKYQAAVRVNDSTSKINQLREEQEECETKLEKERDIWAAEMFELIAEEDNMAKYVINYIKYQQLYYKSALEEIEDVMNRVGGLIKGNNKKIFKVRLEDHLAVTNRTISYVIELCVCYLLEKGLLEEGLLRVGCAGSKLRRLRSAIDANIITTPFPNEYQDVHVIASVLKSYLRDLPEPLLTFDLYDQFIAAAQKPLEEARKLAILNSINQLPKHNYLNLRYLTKFLELLAQKSKSNKMSPQNIAIVMSPNLLWSPETSDADYVTKVNSTASVNTIVEALVSDWTYFFGDEFTRDNFYVTMSHDELFPHNDAFLVDRDFNSENITSKSLNVVPSSINNHSKLSTNNNASTLNSAEGNNISAVFRNSSGHQTHFRGSSHDTSLILLESEIAAGGMDSMIKRSQSNSSLSDSSPPQQDSPKLPLRRKHNKQVAPTPPDNRFLRLSEHFASGGSYQNISDNNVSIKEQFLNSGTHHTDEESKVSLNRFIQNDSKVHSSVNPPANTCKQQLQPVSLLQYLGSTENLAIKPDKPPRPAMPLVESQTLVRSAFKSKGIDRHGRPVALPRNTLNVARSTENLSSSSSISSPVKKLPSTQNRIDVDVSDAVFLRDQNNSLAEHSNRPDKPAIPERPTSLMKSNFRTAVFDKFDTHQMFHNQLIPCDQSPGIKKTQSFRISSTPAGTATGGTAGRSLTTLERTHIYNVVKQQVEIIDVSDQQNNGSGATKPLNSALSGEKEQATTIEDAKPSESTDGNAIIATSDVSAIMTNSSISTITECVPQSPRCFEPKIIKRPQIPAPPPPNILPNATLSATPATTATNQGNEHTNHKLDGTIVATDSTKL